MGVIFWNHPLLEILPSNLFNTSRRPQCIVHINGEVSRARKLVSHKFSSRFNIVPSLPRLTCAIAREKFNSADKVWILLVSISRLITKRKPSFSDSTKLSQSELLPYSSHCLDHYELQIAFERVLLKHNPFQKYLEITLRKHITNTALKIKNKKTSEGASVKQKQYTSHTEKRRISKRYSFEWL